jgi:hypothetical protein
MVWTNKYAELEFCRSGSYVLLGAWNYEELLVIFIVKYFCTLFRLSGFRLTALSCLVIILNFKLLITWRFKEIKFQFLINFLTLFDVKEIFSYLSFPYVRNEPDCERCAIIYLYVINCAQQISVWVISLLIKTGSTVNVTRWFTKDRRNLPVLRTFLSRTDARVN